LALSSNVDHEQKPDGVRALKRGRPIGSRTRRPIQDPFEFSLEALRAEISTLTLKKEWIEKRLELLKAAQSATLVMVQSADPAKKAET